MSLIRVDLECCNQDGLCARVCPVGIIQLGEDRYPTPIDRADDLCIGCGHCVAICPTGCLDHRHMRASDCSPLDTMATLPDQHIEQLFKVRRSVRNFKKKQLEKGDVYDLLDIVRYAPSGHNSGGVNWLALANKDELHALKESVAGWMGYMLGNMNELAASLHLDTTLERWKKGEDVILRGAPMVLVAYAEENSRMAPASCSIALSHLELAASAKGFGACWAGYFNVAANS